jgi:uncharacterized repeat protein (TIGR03803 family)
MRDSNRHFEFPATHSENRLCGRRGERPRSLQASWWPTAWAVLMLSAATPIPLRAQALTVLHSFDGADGANSAAALIQAADGNFYGTTVAGGANNSCSYFGVSGCGTIFEITPSGTLTTLYSFCSQSGCLDGNFPFAALIQAADGNFYGTTAAGGANDSCSYYLGFVGCGTVFEITPSGTLTTLYSFCSQSGCADGGLPNGLIQGSDGNLYGTASFGGANGEGTVFQITPSGTLTTLYSFCSQANCTDGSGPAGLVQGTDGNFYGTTTYGGLYQSDYCNQVGCGTVFKITPSGTLTSLWSFCSQGSSSVCTDGGEPKAGLVQGTDGNFYGTTSLGGPEGVCTGVPGCGTVFRISPTGTLTTLHTFDSTDGAYPLAALVQGTDGNFYGTTSAFQYGQGRVFQITPSGTLTTIYNFCSQSNCADGENLQAALVQATNGNFYGTTTFGGASDACELSSSDYTCGGTVFSLSLAPIVGLSPTSVTFSSQPIGTVSAVQVVTLTNTGNGTLTFGALVLAGTNSGDFLYCASMDVPTARCRYAGIVDCGVTMSLDPGGSCTVGLAFDPTAAGTRVATLSFNDNAPGSPQVIDLMGTGTGPGVTLSTGTVSVGGQVVGTTSAAQTVTLTNTGNAALNITSIAITPAAFTETNKCGASLAAGASCIITVMFTPSSAGEISGTLTITDNAFGSPHRVSLSGVGQDFTIGPYNLSVTVIPGATTSGAFQVAPLGGFNQTVSLACSGAPQEATCTLNPTSVVLDGRNRAAIGLQLSTTAPTSGGASGGRWPALPPSREWFVAMGAALLLGLLGLLWRASPLVRLDWEPQSQQLRLRILTLSGVLLLAAIGWAACGGGSTPPFAPPTGGTPAGNYTLTVTATSGHLTHSSTVQLSVQ